MTKIGITIYGCEQDESALFHEMSPQFGILPTITIAEPSASNAMLASGSRCVSVSHKTKITKPVLGAFSRVGVNYISTRSIGYDHIDLNAAKALGISVGNIAYSPDSVADYTVMLILMALRNTKSVLLRGNQRDFSLDNARGKELRDMTVGIIGTGRIGSKVMHRLQGFDCRMLAYDDHPNINANYVPLEKLLRESDVISLHTPLTPDTYHLLNRERLKLVKDGAFLINTGRGPLVDTKELLSALREGALGGAALDVLEGEEGLFYFNCSQKQIQNELLLDLQAMPNVIITPHVAYHTQHSLRDTVENTLENCLIFERKSTKCAN